MKKMINQARKIPSFTMVDVLSGMVITSIIVSMVFYLFTALNKQVAVYGQVRNDLNSFMLMRVDFKRQFELTDKEITGVPFGVSMTGDSDNLTYVKEDNYLLRITNEITDTLSSSLEEFNVEFIHDKNGEPTNKVKGVNIIVKLDNQNLGCHVYKDYGLIEQINQDLLNEF